MRKKQYTRIAMILLLLLIYMFIQFLLFYQQKQTTYDLLSNGLYHEHALVIAEPELIDWNALELEDKDIGMYIEITPFMRIQVKDTLGKIPPMIWGEYPQDIRDRPKAVVGKELYHQLVQEKENGQWIECLEQRFEVVGVIGVDYPTSCDYLILLFPTTNLEDFMHNSMVIDAKSEDDLREVKGKILSHAPNSLVQEREGAGMARITKHSYYFRLLYLEAMIFIGLTIFFLTKFQWVQYTNQRKVYCLLGIGEEKIILAQLVEMIGIHLGAFVIAMGLSKQFKLMEEQLLFYFLMISGIILVSCMAFILLFWLIEKMSWVKVKRGFGGKKGSRRGGG